MAISDFGLLDIVIFGILGLSAFFGLWRGFIKSILSLISWFLAMYLTYQLYPAVTHIILGEAKETLAVMVFGHIILLIVLLIMLSFATTIILTLTGPLRLGFIDNTLGLIFGGLRGAVVATCLYMGIVAGINLSLKNSALLDDDEHSMPKWLLESATYPFMQAEQKMLTAILPMKTKTGLHEAYVDLTNKGLDERFVDYSVHKIVSALPMQDQSEIASYKEANSMRKSAFALETDVIEKTLDAYDRAIATNMLSADTIDPTEVARLRALLRQRHAASTKAALTRKNNTSPTP